MNESPLISVLISTHNPDTKRLSMTLEALENQTLTRNKWQLVLVDNASNPPVLSSIFADCPSVNARLIQEPRLGLTYGRIAGIKCSNTPFIVFVDDDNCISSDYLEQVASIFSRYSQLGLAGGKIEALWEEREPEEWAIPFLQNLAIRDHGEEIEISNPTSPKSYPSKAPVGAGMAARSESLRSWVEKCEGGTSLTGRQGASLSSAEDCDMVLHALQDGWSVGYFPSLSLKHIIPSTRLSKNYLADLGYGIAISWLHVLNEHEICPWKKINSKTLPLRKLRSYLRTKAWSGPAAYIRWKTSCGHFEGLASIPQRSTE